MPDLQITTQGPVARITLTREHALNALSWEMCREIEKALDTWRDDPAIAFLMIDAAGDKAFCAGGDVTALYEAAQRQDYAYGQRFWADEYRMNAKLFNFPKPVVTFLHGYTLGGGVGLGCHGSHRIVCENSKIALPECSLGLIPDVGGSLLLARAPGRLGEYLGVTGHRLDANDAIYAGFADYFIPQKQWDSLKETLLETGDIATIDSAARPATTSTLETNQEDINRLFAGDTLRDILIALQAAQSSLAEKALQMIAANSPLAMACAVEIQHRLGPESTIEAALGLEYRFSARALEQSDFPEGIRAKVIDRDNAPRWRHSQPEDVASIDVSKMLMPLGKNALRL